MIGAACLYWHVSFGLAIASAAGALSLDSAAVTGADEVCASPAVDIGVFFLPLVDACSSGSLWSFRDFSLYSSLLKLS